MISLQLPNVKYKESYLDAVREYQTGPRDKFGGEGYHELDTQKIGRDFEGEVVKPALDAMQGIGLPEGYVPSTEFWVINEDGYVGHVNFRHDLTPHLKKIGGHVGYGIRPSQRRKGYASAALQLALKEASKQGLSEVLVTCNQDNAASKKAILKAIELFGGREDTPVADEDGKGSVTLRFWINTVS